MDETVIGAGGRSFPPTSWSTIVRGGGSDPVVRQQSLEKLFSRYWPPVYCCVRFGWNKSPEEAKDAVQGFFLDLYERDFLEEIGPEKGRFRSFLKASLKNYMLNLKRDAARLKRGGGRKTLSLDGYEDITAEPGEPESVFDAAWYQTLVRSAVEELKESLASGDREVYYRILERYDLSRESLSYEQVAREFDLSESDVRNYLHYARKVLRRIVIRRVSEYALDEEDVREELRWILG